MPLLPRSLHPASFEPISYGVNRYILLEIHKLLELIATFDYLRASPMRGMHFLAGAFAWQCSQREHVGAALHLEAPLCELQRNGI